MKYKSRRKENKNITLEVKYNELIKDNPYLSDEEICSRLDIDLEKLNDIRTRLQRFFNNTKIEQSIEEKKVEKKTIKFKTSKDKEEIDLKILTDLWDKYPSWSIEIMSLKTNIVKGRIVRLLNENPNIRKDVLFNEKTILDLIEKDLTLKEICEINNIGIKAMTQIIEELGYQEQKRWKRL